MGYQITKRYTRPDGSIVWRIIYETIVYDGKPWFVKFAITDGELEEISFHPPEKDLKTEGGLLIPKG